MGARTLVATLVALAAFAAQPAAAWAIDVDIFDNAAAEGNAGSSQLSLAVVLSDPAPAGGISVDWATSNGTATAGSDYTAATGTLVINELDSAGSIDIDILGDTALEPDETFTVTLSAVTGTGAVLVDGVATATILEDDFGAQIFDSGLEEGDPGSTPTMSFSVVLTSPAPPGGISLTYATTAGTATAGVDYTTVAAGTVTILEGNVSADANVSILPDIADEPTEDFTVTLSGAPTGVTITDATASGNIVDDDFFWKSCGSFAITQQCVTSFTVNGGAPPAGVELHVFGAADAVQIQVQYNDLYELVAGAAPLATTDVVQAQLNLGPNDPVGTVVAGAIDSIAATLDATTGNTLTIVFRPRPSSWLDAGCTIGGCGDDTTAADVDFEGMLIGSTFDWPAPPGGLTAAELAEYAAMKENFRGAWVATNAQSFSFPFYNPVTNAFEFDVAAPHLEADGLTVNTGFFTAFLPDALLTNGFGIADPSTVTTSTLTVQQTSGGITTTVTPSVSVVAGGVRVEVVSFSYSTPSFSIARSVSTSGSGSGSGGASGGATPPEAPPVTPAAPAPAAPPGPVAGTTFVGSDAADRIVVGDGGFILVTGAGRDVVRSGAGPDRVALGTGNDVALLGAGDDRAFGGAGDDVLLGGAGDDKLTGGRGLDRLVGGSGNDVLGLRDGRGGDRAACGLGRDVVFADRGDRIARDCEVIRWAR